MLNQLWQEMNLLVEADQPGNRLDDYVSRLNAILSQKAAGILQLQTRLAHFQKRLKEHNVLVSSSGCWFHAELQKAHMVHIGSINPATITSHNMAIEKAYSSSDITGASFDPIFGGSSSGYSVWQCLLAQKGLEFSFD